MKVVNNKWGSAHWTVRSITSREFRSLSVTNFSSRLKLSSVQFLFPKKENFLGVPLSTHRDSSSWQNYFLGHEILQFEFLSARGGKKTPGIGCVVQASLSKCTISKDQTFHKVVFTARGFLKAVKVALATAELIFVTNIKNYICGEKICHVEKKWQIWGH